MTPRLGELLIERGCITREQCEHILFEQARSGRPFGELAESLFDVDPADLEAAWADQYESISPTIDPAREQTDVRILSMVSRRQAWQFRIVPLRRDGAEIMICTAREHLPRALRFAYRHFGPACYFVLTNPERLAEALDRHYPLPGARQELADWHARHPREGKNAA